MEFMTRFLCILKFFLRLFLFPEILKVKKLENGKYFVVTCFRLSGKSQMILNEKRKK